MKIITKFLIFFLIQNYCFGDGEEMIIPDIFKTLIEGNYNHEIDDKHKRICLYTLLVGLKQEKISDELKYSSMQLSKGSPIDALKIEFMKNNNKFEVLRSNYAFIIKITPHEKLPNNPKDLLHEIIHFGHQLNLEKDVYQYKRLSNQVGLMFSNSKLQLSKLMSEYHYDQNNVDKEDDPFGEEEIKGNKGKENPNESINTYLESFGLKENLKGEYSLQFKYEGKDGEFFHFSTKSDYKASHPILRHWINSIKVITDKKSIYFMSEFSVGKIANRQPSLKLEDNKHMFRKQ